MERSAHKARMKSPRKFIIINIRVFTGIMKLAEKAICCSVIVKMISHNYFVGSPCGWHIRIKVSDEVFWAPFTIILHNAK
jgi:hypothetical protein